MNRSLGKSLRVFMPFALGYFLSYLYRVVNAVIAPDLVGDLGIGPSALGLLTATYFISFASASVRRFYVFFSLLWCPPERRI